VGNGDERPIRGGKQPSLRVSMEFLNTTLARRVQLSTTFFARNPSDSLTFQYSKPFENQCDEGAEPPATE